VSVLVFPAVGSSGCTQAQTWRSLSLRVVAASSVGVSPVWRDGSDAQCHLPMVDDASFAEQFEDLCLIENITAIFAPVPAVHAFFARNPTILGDRTLLGEQPIAQVQRRGRQLLARARALDQLLPDIDSEMLASVLWLCDQIHGECDDIKIAALIAAVLAAPAGDLVEIGTLLGRSAAALRIAGGWRGCSGLFCIDPWQATCSRQESAPAWVRDDMVTAWDYELMPLLWRQHLRLISGCPLGCWRLPSIEAAPHYATGEPAVGCDGEAVHPAKGIALLHIDGNHDVEAVAADWAAWSPFLQPQAWIVFDDYCWRHGDGVRVFCDRLLPTVAVRRAFVCAGALFVEMT
jgi:hypothetical protein